MIKFEIGLWTEEVGVTVMPTQTYISVETNRTVPRPNVQYLRLTSYNNFLCQLPWPVKVDCQAQILHRNITLIGWSLPTIRIISHGHIS